LRIIKVILACLAVLISLPLQAKRVALVMGNDNYTSVSKLQKAGNDATAMARELKNAGFTVQLHKDLNYRGMVRAVEAFTNNITGGDEVVVFFAGHGVQIKNGSYLLPTDIEASSESEVEKTAYELLALTDKISEAKPAFSLVMVDACRDNPLKSKGRNIGNARGLSAIEPPKGQMVVYSASRGQQALDRLSDKDPNPNGVFTREFITQMKKPGVRIEDIMRSVQDSVETLAKSVSHEQRPAVYNEARGNFYFFGPTTVQVAPAQQKPDANALELALWDGVKNATTIAEVQAYLNRFPQGFFAELARARIVALGSVNAERVAADNNLRLAEEARIKEQQRIALEAQKQEQVRLAQEAKQKEQERLMAEQRVKEQERVAAFNAQKLVDQKAREEAERKVALERAAQELAKQRDAEQAKLLAHEKAFKDEIKRLEEEKTIKDAAERIALTTAAIERAQRMAAQEEAERSANKPSVNLIPTETSEAQKGQSEFDRVIEEARIEAGKRFQETLILYSSGATFQDCEDCPKMVVIPAGNFQMGSVSNWFSSAKPPDNEQPARNVSIKSFALGKFEVTQKQWRELMGTSPSKFQGDDLPVEQVTWEEVYIYLDKLSVKTGRVYRLPSEAEWEYAALAGQQSEYPSGDSASGISRLAWFNVTTNKTEPVGTRQGNKFGLFDMYGNVEEWTEDCSNQNYEKAPTNGSPWLEGLCSFRVVRGGAWSHSVKYLRSKSRHQVHQRSKEDNLGFRVVREILN
jgi:formylglycine-generating enzyme required for sulfatase activity